MNRPARLIDATGLALIAPLVLFALATTTPLWGSEHEISARPSTTPVVLTATTRHMDQHKEIEMAKKPMDFDEFNDRRKAIDPEVQRLAEYGRPIGRWATFEERIEDMERMQRAQDGGR